MLGQGVAAPGWTARPVGKRTVRGQSYQKGREMSANTNVNDDAEKAYKAWIADVAGADFAGDNDVRVGFTYGYVAGKSAADRKNLSGNCYVTPDELGLLLFCALAHGRRMVPRNGLTVKYWDKLPQVWRDRINTGGETGLPYEIESRY